MWEGAWRFSKEESTGFPRVDSHTNAVTGTWFAKKAEIKKKKKKYFLVLTFGFSRLGRSNYRHLYGHYRLWRGLFQEAGRALHEQVPFIPSRAEVNVLPIHYWERISSGTLLRRENFSIEKLRRKRNKLVLLRATWLWVDVLLLVENFYIGPSVPVWKVNGLNLPELREARRGRVVEQLDQWICKSGGSDFEPRTANWICCP